MASAETLGFKPSPLHKLLTVMGGGKAALLRLLCELWGWLPQLYVMLAIPVLSALLLTPSSPCRRGG